MDRLIKKYFWLALLVTATLITTEAAAGFMPYGRIFKAVKDERPYITQAQDSRLQLQLHKEILLKYPQSLIEISSYVYLGHGFVVGEVEDEAQRNGLIHCAKSIGGLNGVSYYLPKKDTSKQNASSEIEIKLKGLIEPEYPSSKITIKVVQNKIVILGVLNSQEQESVCNEIKKMCGPMEIINFLQVPQVIKKRRSKFRPVRNFLRD
ncbi:hypothetical protein [Maridesulfovibrio sp.]|uniref:hypothetical protein n=1 Tax=Maridesulfovibrio sp. TaxID=2795000 RepID=UPI0029C9E9D5|nr:hypothetical protein [Maridesulfovibrio sp.]